MEIRCSIDQINQMKLIFIRLKFLLKTEKQLYSIPPPVYINVPLPFLGKWYYLSHTVKQFAT